MAVRLITIDVDGTLLSSGQTVPKDNIKAIQEAMSQGSKIVIASGRPLSGIMPWLKIIGVPIADDQFVIAFNGGVVQTTSGKLLEKNQITYQGYEQLQAFADQQQAYFQVESLDGSHTIANKIPKEAQMENYLINADLQIHKKMPEQIEFIKPMINGSKDELDRIIKLVPTEISRNFNVVRGAWYNLEFMSKKASKGNALHMLSHHLGIENTQTMAIGDQQNDLSMFSQAHYAIAMGNADDAIKNQADFTTKSNDEAGVALAIRKFALAKS
ncbi:Cof-type HAD-IIB family hydrolase [Oenococcus sp.]|uniref:Cof-type HAD-IIB family hydrolase n=1 Tax=Oenococcus sp. TaxID=1979414 RepID=UPI0039EBFEEB